MNAGWRVGSIFGIPLLLDPSWFYILALFTFSYGSGWQQEGWGSGWAWIAGLVMALLLFASVLLHELGHSLVALSQGIKVNSITLFIYGGIASIDQESKTPGQAFQVAIAGPAVSFGLFLLLSAIRLMLPLGTPVATVIENLAGINLVLTLFNMLPGLPLDGGQVLKAAIWKITGSRLKGMRWAAKAGQMLGWAAVILGITFYLNSLNLSYLWLVLLGWFGLRNADAYTRITHLQEALTQLTAGTAMTRQFRVVDAEQTLHQFATTYLADESATDVYYAASDGRYRGLVAVEELQSIERSLWEMEPLSQIIHPLTEIPAVTETTPLTEVIEQLETTNLRRLTVLSPAGAVAGVIDRGDVVRALAEKLRVPIPEPVIKRIKEEGKFPPELQLQAIAKAAKE